MNDPHSPWKDGPPLLSRRQALGLLARAGGAAALARAASVRAQSAAGRRDFDVRDFGAAGDGLALDTAAIQRAIDAAAPSGGRVVLPGGRRFLSGTLVLRSGIEFHLADDAVLLASLRPDDYAGGREVVRAVMAQPGRVPGVQPGQAEHGAWLLTAPGAVGLRLSGTGTVDGRSPEFMERYDPAGEWYRPRPFRPNLAVLVGCRDLEVSGLTFARAPIWTLHLVGCERVLVEGVRVRNQLEVPNCDGIDPDHCRSVEIRRCDIVCGDDAICVKSSRPFASLGETSDIRVSDCDIETQDAGLKIGTETVGPIRRIRFENCRIRGSSRGLGIQLRDEGDISDVLFRDITFRSRCHSDPWWGRGEAISFTVVPRTEGGRVGGLRDVRVENVTGTSENSIRLSGCRQSRLADISLDNVAVTLNRESRYPGGAWDNRPTAPAYQPIERHGIPGIDVRHADRVSLRRCRIAWGPNRPDYYTYALEAEDATGLSYPDFSGTSAHPGRLPPVSIT